MMKISSKIYICWFFFRVQTRGLDVNQILDILDEEQIADVEEIYLQPPGGDDSDGYDVSDTEEGHSGQLSRTILQVNVWIIGRYFGPNQLYLLLTCLAECFCK
jgi:hypothetical protein